MSRDREVPNGERDPLAVPRRAVPPHERRLTLVALLTVLAGPLAWLVQLWLLTLVTEIPCREQAGQDVLGVPVEAWWLIVSGGSGLVAAAAAFVAWRLPSRVRGSREGDRAWLLTDSADDAHAPGMIVPLSALGLWSSTLSLLVIALAATALLFLGCLSGSGTPQG